MNIIDLTHPFSENMTLFPGTPKPVFKQKSTYEENGYREKQITITSHIGTHIDAPAHAMKNGKTLDQLPISNYVGSGICIDVSELRGKEIPLSIIEKDFQPKKHTAFIILHSGYYKKWGSDEYLQNFPVLSSQAAEYIVSCGVKGVGVDMISVDPTDSTTLPIHIVLLGNNIVIIENLNNTQELLNKEFTFHCAPLPIFDADGSPVRVYATIDQ